jgi:hypothetical protein
LVRRRWCVMTKRMFAVLLIALIAALALCPLVKNVADSVGWGLSDLASVFQIIEGFVAIALLISALVFAEEIRESVRSRHLDGMRYVKSLIGTQEASDDRKWVYQDLKKTSWPLSPEDEVRALSVCRDVDHIGFLCRCGLIPTKLVVETYNRNIVEMWDRLERFVVQWRQARHDEDYFGEFEWLARKAREAGRRMGGKRRGPNHNA